MISARAVIDWLLAGMCAIAYALVAIEAIRLLRRFAALRRRVQRLAGSPLRSSWVKGRADLRRIGTAATASRVLVVRAIVALMRIRALVGTIVRIGRYVSGL